MNSLEFNARVQSLLDTLTSAGLLKHLKEFNFSASDLAQLQIQLSQNAIQGALSLQELDFKKQSLAIEAQKARQELEIGIVNAKLSQLATASDAVTKAIQAEAIKRSVTDNANINKANALVGYFDVAMNAIANNANSLSGTLKEASESVLNAISEINTDELETFAPLVNDLVDRADELSGIGSGNKQVSIIAPKLEIDINESVSLLGISAFGDNEASFLYKSYTNAQGEKIEKNITYNSKTLNFRSQEIGTHEIEFSAISPKGRLSDCIFISVVEPKYKKECE